MLKKEFKNTNYDPITEEVGALVSIHSFFIAFS
jgi:hypothetical protein